MSQEANQLKAITTEEWENLYKKLLLYTYRRYGWLRQKNELDLEDVVQQAIADIFEGKRRYPPVSMQREHKESQIDFFVFLCNVIRSKISHLVEREQRKISLDPPGTQENVLRQYLEDKEQDTSESHSKDYSSKYSQIIGNSNAEDHIIQQQLVERIYKLIGEDALLIRIVQMLIEEPTLRPREIAEQLGISLKEVYNATKRLRRQLMKLQEELRNASLSKS